MHLAQSEMYIAVLEFRVYSYRIHNEVYSGTSL